MPFTEIDCLNAAAQHLEDAAFMMAGSVDTAIVSNLILMSAEVSRVANRFSTMPSPRNVIHANVNTDLRKRRGR